MATILESLQQLKLKKFNSLLSKEQIQTADVFAERTGNYLNQFNLFISYFKSYPHLIYEKEINGKKANEWFLKTYFEEIKDYHINILGSKRLKENMLDEAFYIIDKDLIVNIQASAGIVRLLFRENDIKKVKEISDGIRKFRFKLEKDDPRIYLLVNTSIGIETKSLKLTKQKINLKDNYNDDFIEIHDVIYKRLSKKKDKGLVLLHGKPGTGKTSYIRYLVGLVKKKVIFLPPNMSSNITNPDLMSILIDNPDSIFVIEDAENIVIDREKDGHSPVSALLNISDGLLSDCLNIQIICSFNTDISKIDSALMRKGRMIAKYEFKELEVNKAQALSNKLSFKTIISKPMTLTEIYNQEEMSFVDKKERIAIGFRRETA